MFNCTQHTPVLINEAINALSLKDEGIYVDATFGLGGYSKEILNKCNCSLLAIDRDPQAKEFAKPIKSTFKDNFTFINGKFSELLKFLKETNINKVNGIVFDLGVSSPQIDTKERGFSFKSDGPLDMRMSLEGPTAEEFINKVEEKTLANIIYEYGEEVFSRRIAKNITNERLTNRIISTGQLATIIRRSIPFSKQKIDPATRTFQAIRIYLNNEIYELEKGLIAAEKSLEPDGILAVVSFHSIEDRIIKEFFLKCSNNQSISRYLPEKNERKNSLEIITRKPISPSKKEIERNRRSRSAKLRVARRTNFPSYFGDGE
ncbi:16S rRNA (cytosine(1402)-N(4))-methyltransferase RsmH [Alphaproteobacteria bacterium]|nr:16S rRNA (cytosine(1402)-N(4))-methyltransferase RsmH [Alphaproteobacteria bacterium]MDC1086643.1 16S rRNA (cytosine(1402)-N(4))-methyltransferase RsmH [Alphaproteobacteria bacterium]